MGFCSKRHFLLTICTLQLIATVERQVFDFLGFMWLPILVNFFNIIFVILGFFGAFQYRPKYLITYCLWDVLWLGWNIFLICFYLEIGGLNKTSDILNFGTGSFSWWQENGPGCKAIYDVTSEPGFLVRPTNVTECILNYEVVEVIHASTQCILVFVAIVGGIFLTRSFMEEDDSFDFVGGGDFGLAGHTPLHPMYVSYSALLSPPQLNQNYQSYPRGGTTSSNNSSLYYQNNNNNNNSNTTLPKIIEKTILNNNNNNNNDKLLSMTTTFTGQNTIKSNKSNNSSSRINNCNNIVDYYNDYSNPVDHLHRPISPNEYDLLENDNNNNNTTQLRLYDRNNHQVSSSTSSSRYYSPVVSPIMRRARPSQAQRQNRNSYRPRIYTDFIRDQPLRSYHSDPRLEQEQQPQQPQQHQRQISSTDNNSRPISLYTS